MRYATWLSLLAYPAALGAQGSSAGMDGKPAGPIVAWVEIAQQNVFDSTDRQFLHRLANALHIVTRRHVILPELLFQSGSTYDSARFEETERNLRALEIFRSVRIDTLTTDSGLVARVRVDDGWSTRPDVGFKSTGGEVAYSLELLEDNLLGTATGASLVFLRQPDRHHTKLEVHRSRVFSGLSAGIVLTRGSDGSAASLDLGLPFRTLDAPFGAFLGLDYSDLTHPRYRDGNVVPGDSVERELGQIQASAGWATRASSRGYLRLGVRGFLQRDGTRETGASFISRSSAGIGPTLEWARARYRVMRGFTSMDRVEDIDLSTAISVSTVLALRAWGQLHDGIAPAVVLRTGAPIRGGFVQGYVDLSGLLSDAGVDSGSVSVGTTVAVRPSGPHLLVLHAEAGLLYHPVPGTEFDIGFNAGPHAGPRGFPVHSFTGDRRVFVNAEHRWTMFTSLFDIAAVGLAGFVEGGGAWFAGSAPRLGGAAGIGLRLDSSRFAKGEVFRIDLVRTFADDPMPGRWVFVLGKGFVF